MNKNRQYTSTRQNRSPATKSVGSESMRNRLMGSRGTLTPKPQFLRPIYSKTRSGSQPFFEKSFIESNDLYPLNTRHESMTNEINPFYSLDIQHPVNNTLDTESEVESSSLIVENKNVDSERKFSLVKIITKYGLEYTLYLRYEDSLREIVYKLSVVDPYYTLDQIYRNLKINNQTNLNLDLKIGHYGELFDMKIDLTE